jgi:hypothetical protein
MNEFREPHLNFDNGRDPLERLVEAFVGLSAPEGPEAGVQQRLIARLSGATSSGAASASSASTLAPEMTRRPRGSARWWVGTLARQFMTLAAGVAVLVAAALWATSRRQGVPEQAAGGGDLAAAPTANQDLVHNDATAFLDRVLQSRGATPDVLAMLSAMMKEQRELAKSPRWQKAQAQLSLALEKPEVIGIGVGLLGTLPVASYGRF